MSDTRKLHICMEAVDANGDHYYVIHSLKLSDLTTTNTPPNQPTLFPEIQFKGHPFMGCGFFDSKILFAGGKLPDGGLHNGFISYDMSTQELSFQPLPSMQHGKLKPLVYQLDDRLYVMDTRSSSRKSAFEYYNPTKQEWFSLSTPMDGYDYIPSPAPHSYGCPSVVVGNACYLTTPYLKTVNLHHPSVTYKSWLPHLGILPFSGVATSDHHNCFPDSVIISFTKGLVQANQFDVYYSIFKHHQELFEVQPSVSDSTTSKHRQELFKVQPYESDYTSEHHQQYFKLLPSESDRTNMRGYFADFGNGVFSLTASDSGFTFKIGIVGVHPDKTMDLRYFEYTRYQYPLDALCPGLIVLSVVGCFLLSPNHAGKERAVEIFDRKYQWFGRRYDDNPGFFVFNGKKYKVPKGHRDGVRGEILLRKHPLYYV